MRRFTLLLIAVILCAPLPAATKRRAVGRGGADPIFGVFLNVSARPDANTLNRTVDLAQTDNIGWLRIQMNWATIQPNAATADYRLYDEVVAHAVADHLHVLAVLGYSTPWNTTAPATETRATQREHYPPADLDAWSRFVFTTVRQYKASVHHWEIWNSPDVGFAPAAGQTCNGSWCGTAAQYAQLLAVAYRAVKQADNNAVVLFGGVALAGDEWNPNFLYDVLTDPDNPGAINFDVMAFKVYGSQQEALRRINYVKQQLAFGNAAARPMWVTEFGYPSDVAKQTVQPYLNGETGQASYLKDIATYLINLGVRKVFWYQLFDTDPSDPFSSYGILTSALAKKQSYTAFGDVIKALQP